MLSAEGCLIKKVFRPPSVTISSLAHTQFVRPPFWLCLKMDPRHSQAGRRRENVGGAGGVDVVCG